MLRFDSITDSQLSEVANRPHYAVTAFIIYTDKAEDRIKQVFYNDGHLITARREAFALASNLVNLISQEHTQVSNIRSWSVGVLLNSIPDKLQALVMIEGSMIDRTAIDQLRHEWKVKYAEVLNGWRKEYDYYTSSGHNTEGEPGEVQGENGHLIKVLPDVLAYISGAVI